MDVIPRWFTVLCGGGEMDEQTAIEFSRCICEAVSEYLIERSRQADSISTMLFVQELAEEVKEAELIKGE